MKHLASCPRARSTSFWLRKNRKQLEAVVQSHIVAGAAMLEEDLLGRAVEVATLGGALAVHGATTVILLVPIEATITEVEGQAEQKSEATPIAAIVVEAPQDSIVGPIRPATRAEQELMGVAMVVEPDIRADNGVIHGIAIVLSRRFLYSS